MISHKTTAHRRIQCTHCPDLKLVVDLNKHLRNTHGIMQNSICEICGVVYTNTRSLQVNYYYCHYRGFRLDLQFNGLIAGSHTTETRRKPTTTM